jgi:hypothetical protein
LSHLEELNTKVTDGTKAEHEGHGGIKRGHETSNGKISAAGVQNNANKPRFLRALWWKPPCPSCSALAFFLDKMPKCLRLRHLSPLLQLSGVWDIEQMSASTTP